MRFLNKIVFINSATIQYAEVMVEGNVHFIGTQGVGKSTLLRAILFFYNADSMKLGISKEKKSFAEYYFPYQNAFLVYEVMRETGPYCILVFKSQGKACFRFIDTGYDKKYFISDDGVAFESWDKTRQLLDADNMYYTRKIDRYEEYRDILYGNNNGRSEFERYAVLQSKQYQNIPRTIQNVFLNSKLEAEFIKQTIIMSLNEDNIEINLQNYTHHLKSFQAQLKDIDQYKQPHVQKQAESVVQFQLAYQYQEKEKNSGSQRLAWAIANVQRNKPRLENKKEKAILDRQELDEKKQAAEKRYRAKADKIQAQISVLESELKKGKEKTEFYSRLGVTTAVEKIARKKEFETQQKQLQQQKHLLTAQFAEVSHKYDALLQGLTTAVATFEQQKKEAGLQLREEAIQKKDEAKLWFENISKDIRQQHKEAVAEARELVSQQQEKLRDVQIKKATARNNRYFEEEVSELQKNIGELQVAIPQAEHLLAAYKSQMETLQKQWEVDETGEKQKGERDAEKLTEKIAKGQADLSAIASKLKNSESALYGWLNQNQKGWEKNIGKVCNEDILFNTQLAPQKTGDGKSLFGISINLAELPVTVKTLAQYEKERIAIEKDLLAAQKEIAGFQQNQNDRLDKLRRKYQPLVKEAKEKRTEQQYLLERRNAELQQARLQLKDVHIKAEDEKRRVLAELESLLLAANEEVSLAQKALLEVEQTSEKQVKVKAKELEKRLAAVDEQLQQWNKETAAELAAYKEYIKKQREAILQQQEAELNGKGADTKRIAEVDQQLTALQAELDYIEKMRDTVTEYKKDKRELIDRMDDFKAKKTLLEQDFDTEEQKHLRQQTSLQDEIKTAAEAIQQIHLQLKQSEEDSKAFADFEHTETYQGISSLYKEEKEIYKTDKRCKVLIDEINTCYYSGKDFLDKLKEAATKFIGNFSKENVFKFPEALGHTQAYHEFAEQLNEFINNSKIDEFEKRVNERFANIINLLGKETGSLMSKGGEIQTVINNINKDFDSKNFVGAIKKIELRLDDSANSVVQTLLQIKNFNDEHGYDLGGLNLFSTVDATVKNKKAVSLLEQLNKAIVEYKRDIITLSDSFELKFRIEENQNDTGWVEKLSNVGSEGTDVLVKAMINIMLLNVFKEGASKRFRDFKLHCMMDEIGKLHPRNIAGILQFANDRNIMLINGSPTETNALDYRHIYKLEKDAGRFTRVKRIISHYAQALN